MNTDAWRGRLRAEIEARNTSKRAISLGSGNGPGYVHSILDEGKDPTIQKLASVCAALGVSLTYILYGFDVAPEDEAILSEMHSSPAKRAAILALLDRGNPS